MIYSYKHGRGKCSEFSPKLRSPKVYINIPAFLAKRVIEMKKEKDGKFRAV
jgi:hypothetical protein